MQSIARDILKYSSEICCILQARTTNSWKKKKKKKLELIDKNEFPVKIV